MAVVGNLRINLGLNSAEFESGMKQVQSKLAGIGKAFAAVGAIGAFTAFCVGIGEAVGRIEEMRKLSSQLDKALENTGNTAKTSAGEIESFADKLERSTGRAAEEVMAVSTNLATFGFSREVFYDAIKLADDMSAAWGGDLKQNAEGLARALADPEKGLAMLTKRGITFTDEQKNMIAGFMKSNDLISAQGVVMNALNEQVKGVAEAGFGGLTKAQANFRLALEGVFEGLANGMQINAGLELSLMAVAAALDFVTANMGTIGKAAAVAGSAIAVALAPTVWAGISTAAVLMANTIVAAIRSVTIAMLANPIGLFIAAIAAAVTAAFMFRDEIFQAIGIDFVGIMQDAMNIAIGAFVGAFEAIKGTWSAIPGAVGDYVYQAAQKTVEGVTYMINETIVSIQTLVSTLNTMLAKFKLPALAKPELMKYPQIENPYAGQADSVAGSVSEAFGKSMGVDYVGKLAESLGFVGNEAETAGAKITGLGTALDGGDGEGGAAGGARKLGAATDETGGKLKNLKDIGESVSSTLQDGFKDLFKGMVTGSGNAMDAISNLLGKLGDLFLDQGFKMLFDGFGNAGGGGFLGGIGKLFGFARGGSIMPGGSGGIDSQLVAFRKSPNERVDITKPGQTLHAGDGSNGRMHITTGVAVDGNGSITSYVKSVVRDGIEMFSDTALPQRVQNIVADPRVR